MGDNNRLEFDIVSVDDTGPGTTSAKRNFQSVEQQAAKSAANMSQSGVSMAREIDKQSGSVLSSIGRLENRAATFGKTGLDKIRAQGEALVAAAGGDEALIKRINQGTATLEAAYRKRAETIAGNKVAATIRKLDEEVAVAGKSGVERLVAQEGLAIARAGGNAVAIESIRKRYSLLKKAEEEASEHGSASKLFLGVKDLAEGQFRYSQIEGFNYLSGLIGGAGIGGAVPQIAIATAAFIGLEAASIGAVKALGEYGEHVENVHLRTGIAVGDVEAFAFAARRGGTDVDVFGRLMRGLSQAADENSVKGKGARTELEKLGISLRDTATGELRPTADVMKDISEALNKIPVGFERDAAALQLFQRVGIENIPTIIRLLDSLKTAKEIGLGNTEGDIVNFAKYKKDMDEAEALWSHFKHSVEEKIAPVVVVSLKFLLGSISSGGGPGAAAGGIGGSISEGIVNAALGAFPAKEEIPYGTGDVEKAKAEYAYNAKVKAHSEAVRALGDFRRERERDPAYQLKEAEQELRSLGEPSEQNISQYRAAYENVQRLEAAKKAREEAKREAERERKLQKELYGQQILDAQKSYNQPLLEASKKEVEGTFKAYEDAEKRKRDAQRSLITEGDKLDTEARGRYFEQQNSNNERDRKLALSQLEFVDAQSIKEKIALEDQKLAIEAAYTERSLQIQVQKIQSEKSVALGKLQAELNTAGPEGQAAYDANAAAVNAKATSDIDEARRAAGDKELTQAQEIANKKTQFQIQENRKLFNSLKDDAGGLFDVLVNKSKTWADFWKGLFKTVILTPAKEIFSKQVAGGFTELLTGQKVSYGEIGSGKGFFGKIGSVLGRAGLGPEKFEIPKVEQPNHIGDVELQRGAVPVVIMNGSAAQGGSSSGVGNFLSLASLPLSLTGVFAQQGNAVIAKAASAVESSIKYGGEDFGGGATTGLDTIFGRLPGAPAYQSGGIGTDSLGGSSTGGGFLSKVGGFLGKIFGGRGSGANYSGRNLDLGGGATSGLPGLFGTTLPGAPAYSDGGDGSAGSSAPSGGFFSGILGKLTGLGGGDSSDIGGGGQDSGGQDGGDSGGGGGVGGGLGKLMLAAGIGLSLDGLKRGGTAGIFETAGGGALIGGKFGGVYGAVVGGAIGATAGLIRKFFFETDRDHTKKLVKQIYGIKINDSTADAIIQIAKQKYGGAISIAVRSQEVRDLLKLYAESLGNKSAKDQFVNDKIHSASLIESGGSLQQGAIYDNGERYAYESPLGTYGGAATLLSTANRESGGTPMIQLNVNGQAASDLLAGQVVRTSTPGFIQGQALRASNASNGRLSQTVNTLSPSAVTR